MEKLVTQQMDFVAAFHEAGGTAIGNNRVGADSWIG